MSEPDLLGQLRIDRNAARPQRRSPVIPGLVALLVLAAAAGIWFAGSRADAPISVRVVSAQPANEPARQGSVLDASGYVVARRQATVSSKTTGKVLEVLIEEGMRVEAGQVLARLEDDQQRADVALREAQVLSSRLQLGEIQAQLSQASSDLGRQQELFQRGLGSESQVELAQSQREALTARLASARGQIQVAERSLEASRVQLAETIIRAPFAGVVIAKAAQPGEMISPVSAGGGFTRTGIGTIVDMDSLEIEVDVNEAFIGRVRAGMPVRATLNAYPDWAIPGEVIAVIPAADRTRATVPVRVALTERDARIVPEMGVRVAFLEAAAVTQQAAPSSAVLIPATALVQRDGHAVVFVIDGQQVRQRRVQSGERRGNNIVVENGLSSGERLVLIPPDALQDGDSIQISSP